MARSFPSVMTTIAFVVFFLAVVAPAPRVSSAVRPPIGGRIGRYSVRPEQVRKVANFLRRHAGDILDVVQEILKPFAGTKGVGDEPAENAASTAGLYIFNLSVGTPVPQTVAGVLDITLSFVWAQCERCSPCLAAAPSFRWSLSSTFSAVPCASQTCQQSVLRQTCQSVASSNCGYTMNYGRGRSTNGYLVGDTFTFGGPASRADGVLFGCSLASYGDFSVFSGASGSFGFGRGQLSLVSQLRLSWFSYLLASHDSDGGDNNLLEFGDDDHVPRSGRGRSIPLLQSRLYPDLYYVKLRGIQVDGQDLTGIPAGTFDLRADGTGGVFLSTTTPATYLEEAAYRVVRQALVGGIKSRPVDGSAIGLDLCYAMPSVDKQLKHVPKLTLVFDGGAGGGGTGTGTTVTMDLKKHNYFFADSSTGLECLTIMPSRGGSVLGSLLQTDTNMTYDIYGGQLIFETATAAAAPPRGYKASSVSLMVLAPLVAWVLLLF